MAAGRADSWKGARDYFFFFASSQPTRVTRSAPKTATPFPLSSAAPTEVPSSFALAMCALHAASISILPATVTLERKQYQPLGLDRRIVLLPMTFTAGRTRIRVGLSVGASLPDWPEPTPNTFT